MNDVCTLQNAFDLKKEKRKIDILCNLILRTFDIYSMNIELRN